MKTLSVLIVIVVSALPSFAETVSPFFASGSCSSLLAPTERFLSPTEALISTLKDLYNRGDLTVPALAAIRDGKNPLDQKRNINGYTHRDVVAEVIARLKQNPAAGRQLDSLIRELEAKRNEQKVKVVDTKKMLLEMVMNEVPEGEFTRGSPNDPVITVDRFYAANIPVTQWQYAFVMHDNPSSNLNSAIVESIDGKSVKMLPNNPVENVSRVYAKKFISVLNKWSEEDNPLIYKIISNHIKGAQIRLLTYYEWLYLLSNGGAWRGPYPDGVTQANLHEYAWSDEKSAGSTQPVAELRPLIIFDRPYYDLLGNVEEWAQDGYGSNGFKFGGSWKGVVNSTHFTVGIPEERDNNTGFRLAEDPP